jgi:hypothetical protein
LKTLDQTEEQTIFHQKSLLHQAEGINSAIKEENKTRFVEIVEESTMLQ